MIMKANKQIGFIYKNNESIDKILKDGDVVFERGFLRERTSTTLPITFGGVGKDLKDYKVYGNTVQSKLPSGYTQVDYIEGSGTQYIGTNIYFDFSQNFRIIGKVINPDITTRKVVIGTYEANGANDFSIEFGGTSNSKPGYLRNYFQAQNNSSSNIWSNIALPQDTVISYDTFYNASVHKCMNFIKYNDTNISYDGDVINVTGVSTHPLRLFLDYRTSSVIQHNIKIGNTKIYKNDILVREFIPCYRNSDNEVGLYDLVNNVFYTNQGTGSFTYGSVAPTPDAPIEVVSCGDRSKNLISLIPRTSSAITSFYDKNTGKMSFSGTAASDWSSLENKHAVSIPAGTYTLSLKDTKSFKITVRFYTDDTDYTQISIPANSKSASKTFTNDIVALQIWVELVSGTTYNEEFYMQLEESPTATPYEPYYDGYKIPVNVRSDNLFDKNNPNIYGGYISAGGIVSGSGDPSNYDIIVYIECKPNTTYALKKMLQSDTENNRFRIGCTSEIPIQGMQTTNFFKYADGTTETRYVYTTSSTAKYLLFYCGRNSNTTSKQQILDSVVIVESSTVPDKYIPYYNETTNIYLDEPLRKIGDYSDYIDFKNGKVVRNIGDIVLNGSEDWGKYTAKTYYLDSVTDYLRRDNIPFCDYYRGISMETGASDMNNRDNNAIALSNNANLSFYRLFINDTRFSNTADLKTWLQSNNVTVNYVLSTPTEETITLPNIPTINGNNTLNIETEITPSQVYIKYKSNV